MTPKLYRYALDTRRAAVTSAIEDVLDASEDLYLAGSDRTSPGWVFGYDIAADGMLEATDRLRKAFERCNRTERAFLSLERRQDG